MNKPDWFLLIEQWRVKGMGVYGVTLPFLVGALGRKAGDRKLGVQHVQGVLDGIIERPIEGYVTETRWCGDIDAPVLTVTSTSGGPHRIPYKCFFPCPSGGGESLVFSSDLQSMFGLNCKDANECYAKLLNHATKFVEKGQYSRNWDDDAGSYKFGDFSQKDLEYIQSTIMLPYSSS